MAFPSADLAGRVLAGDVRAVARAISVVERGGPEARALTARLYVHGGRALVVGVTGAPGSGKSTLVDRLVSVIRRGGATVGVVAVDPSSPFTGGAVLGDRIRMGGHAGDDGVFVRSMATRGHLGGLSGATADAVSVLDAAGRDVVVVETVGVGQDEVEIMQLAAVTLLVLVPGMGDEVQALKAGVMEIADVFVVNKADRPEADRLVAEVEANLALRPARPEDWVPPVLKTQATGGVGVDAVWEAVNRCRGHLVAAGRDERSRLRHESRVREAVARQAVERVVETAGTGWEGVMADVLARRIDPDTAADRLLARAFGARPST